MQLEIPEGYEIDLEKSCLKSGEVVLKKSNQFPKWEELGSISGYYIDDSSSIWGSDPRNTINENKNIFKTEYQARASLAIAQLTQLMAYVNGDWDLCTGRWIINFDAVNLYVHEGCVIPRFLMLKDEATAQGFLNAYEDLIKQAAPILWGVEL